LYYLANNSKPAILKMSKYFLLSFLHIIMQPFLIHSGGQTSVYFSGNDSYISIDNSPEINLSVFTIECWFMRKDTGISVITGTDSINAVPIIAKGVEEVVNEANMNYFLGIRKEDSILVAAFEESNTSTNPGKNHHIVGFTSVYRNKWYHAAVTYDGKFLKLYLNGNLETALEINKQPMNQSPVKTVIGGVLLSGDFLAGSFNGLIDEIRIWNYARTQAEIQNKINKEILSSPAGLVIRLGLNEGTGNEIYYTGLPGLNPHITGTGWAWTPGTEFDNFNPPVCNELPLLKIGLIADPQYCDCDPKGTRYYRETLKKLPAAIDTFNKYEVDFVVTLGDIIDKYYESFDSILPLYNNLGMPDYKLLGNHAFEEVNDSLKDTVIHLYSMPDYYYHFTYSDWRFIILDGTELAAYDSILHPDLRDEADSLRQSIQGQINDEPWNGGIGRKQRQWIENTITEAINNNEKVILLCHFPVYPGHSLNLWNREDIIEIVEKYDNAVAYINGHNHDGNYGFLNGKHYVTQKGMVETYDTSSFSILEIYDNKLVFNNYGLMKDHTVSYKNNSIKTYGIILSNNILTYAIDSGDFAGTFSAIDSSGTGNYSYKLTDGYSFEDNSLFDISNDSLYLATSRDLSLQEEYFIKVAAMNCCLDTITRIVTIYFDTNAVHLSRNIPDTVLVIGQVNLNIALDSVFIDKSENGLAYNVISGNTGKALASIDAKNLVVQQISGGETKIIVSATDSFTNQSVTDTFLVTIIDPFNHVPEVVNTIDDLILQLKYDTLVIDLDTIFHDQDSDSLIYELILNNDTTLDFLITNSILELFPLKAGVNVLDLSADDDRGGSVSCHFELTVNTVPQIYKNISDMSFFINDPPFYINMDTVFFDPDGDTLVYLANISNSDILETGIADSELMLSAKEEGITTIEVSADDKRGGTVTDDFNVTISAISTNLYDWHEKPYITNYPNPFSRKTRLSYNLSKDSYIRLSIFNQYGQLIKVLVSEKQDKGNHEVFISASDLSPGIYFCRLEIGDRQVNTKIVKGTL
jgi:manganese-dependent ADP-ribose/CDP-alcohol diphosphatase